MHRTDWIVPAALFLAAIMAQYSGLDIWLAKHFYNQGAHSWPLRDHWLTTHVLHTGARRVITAIGIGLLLGWVFSLVRPPLAHVRRLWGYLFLASISGPIIVALLKSVTHQYTPWDLALFGGHLPHVRIFDPLPPDAPVGHAFPAGHASAGYAFFSLYFLARFRAPHLRWKALTVPVLLGATLGIDQQLRGAHFLSHDLTTAAICWLAAALCAHALLKPASSWLSKTAQQTA